ncbi:hypothetical protein AGMMS49944_07420 [Spirochaetia bacterium]|nr:hypothetical protein AGMMS49944_07420 [Spirochaetia bacterium]
MVKQFFHAFVVIMTPFAIDPILAYAKNKEHQDEHNAYEYHTEKRY